ncbi:allantoicase [Streptomyces sp. NPDC014894]|uniref:allantoicase n=1 Tax=Streptomyces sp. NPDC014894 TaxID=3364931 RepID=UPI0036F6BE10
MSRPPITDSAADHPPEAPAGHPPDTAADRLADTAFTGAARPYAGGDPYADYRTAGEPPSPHWADLADRRLGASVIAANDEFFAHRERLLLPGRAEFHPDRFGPKGKIMDGWETRRRRGESAERPHPADDDHDWALIRLGAPGVVRAVLVDTAHFRGNHPAAVSVEAASVAGTPSPAELRGPGVTWTTLVPRTAVGGHAANRFTVRRERRFTHLRLNQHPDGGVARLRVYGEVAPDPEWLGTLGVFDLVALENGGRVEDASDLFYSPAVHTIGPGRPGRMDDGWETRRRRDRGHDWIRYRLAERARVRAVEIDTAYLVGNSAGWAAVSLRDGPGARWTEILPRTRLQPDTLHRFRLPEPAAGSEARIDIHPDGGIARLRLFGELTPDGASRLAARHRELGG